MQAVNVFHKGLVTGIASGSMYSLQNNKEERPRWVEVKPKLKLQNGGNIPPITITGNTKKDNTKIYIDKEEFDKANKAYQDSLQLYNLSRKNALEITNIYPDSYDFKSPMSYRPLKFDKFYYKYWYPGNNIAEVQLYNKAIHSNIRPIGHYPMEGYAPAFLKPQQQPIYQKPIEYAKSSGIRQEQRPNYITKVTGHPQWGEVYFINEGGIPKAITKAEAVRSGLQIVDKPYGVNYAKGVMNKEERPTQPNIASRYLLKKTD